MTATPIWFGPSDRLLFGWFHSPEGGRARGGVVMCPPIGRDYLRAHYALRRTAIELEEAGLCTIRFDYDGTGDSVGNSTDPDRVDAWLASVDHAIDLLRSAGITWVALAGMRSGALLASTVAARRQDSLDALVLVDPTPSGRAFVSEQRGLAAIALGVASKREDGSIEAPGFVLDAQTQGALKSLRIGSESGPLAKQILVLTRKGTTVESNFASRLSGDEVAWDVVTGQEGLVDEEAPRQALPVEDIERVAGWISKAAPSQDVAVEVPERAGDAVVAVGPDGREVIERPISLGPTGLFGMVTEVPGESSGPVMVFLNVATEPHIGPARLWVELAHEWALLGLRSVRADVSGIGESPSRPGEPEFVIFLPVAFEDVAEIVEAVSPKRPRDVVLLGLCSSAYQGLESAVALAPGGVVAINPVLTFQPPEMLAGGPVDSQRRVALPRGSVIQQFHAEGPLSGLRKRFPDIGWRVRTLMAVKGRPSAWLKDITSSSVDLMLICGDREARPIQHGTSRRMLKRLKSTGYLTFDHIAGLDHGLLVEAHREKIRQLVTDHVVARFIPSGPDSADAEAKGSLLRS